ncbi:MAG: 4-vinyl reductase [Candidatus Limivivens sp.]|nr:4-vinyl reductase [Candidatus Limivivens sp.]
MVENIFLEDLPKITFEEYMKFNADCRENMGEMLPLSVYRLLEYSIREELYDRFGKDTQIEIFRKAGYRSGCYFANHMLNLQLPMNEFVAELQNRMVEMKIGVLRLERLDEQSGKMILTVAEDADCSGLPILGETVCNYDEGFIAGILSTYTGKPYVAVEVDCWATGERVCRFCAEVKPE